MDASLQYDEKNGCKSNSVFHGYTNTFADVLDIRINLCIRYAPRGEKSPTAPGSKTLVKRSYDIPENSNHTTPTPLPLDTESDCEPSQTDKSTAEPSSMPYTEPLNQNHTASPEYISNTTLTQDTNSTYTDISVSNTVSHEENCTCETNDYNNISIFDAPPPYVPMTRCPPPLPLKFKTMMGNLETMNKAEEHARKICEETLANIRAGGVVEKIPVYIGTKRPVISDGSFGTVTRKIVIVRRKESVDDVQFLSSSRTFGFSGMVAAIVLMIYIT